MKPALSLLLCLISTPCLAQDIAATETEVQAFVGADSNGDGVLDAPEFRSFIQAMAAAGQPTARRVRFFGAYDYAFGVVDSDGDGALTPVELRRGDEAHR